MKGIIIMAMTLEELNEMYKDIEEDEYWFHMQAVLGYESDRQKAYDENGNFHCINWFDCRYCPAFNAEHCL